MVQRADPDHPASDDDHPCLRFHVFRFLLLANARALHPVRCAGQPSKVYSAARGQKLQLRLSFAQSRHATVAPPGAAMASYATGPTGAFLKAHNGVSQWDVAVERQVQLEGPDAGLLAQILSPRDLSRCKVGQGNMYAA